MSTIRANTITDTAGTGAPTFSNGIISNGNVGIGTSSPVNNAGYTTLTISGTSGGVLQLQDGANSRAQLYSTSSGVTLISLGAIPLFFGTQGTARAAIDSVGNFQFNNGYGSIATAYGCRAWVNFNGTGTVAIRASGNVTSITDNGVGDYTVNFTTAMPDANYSANVSIEWDTVTAANTRACAGYNGGRLAASFRMISYYPATGGGYVDVPAAYLSVFR